MKKFLSCLAVLLPVYILLDLGVRKIGLDPNRNITFLVILAGCFAITERIPGYSIQSVSGWFALGIASLLALFSVLVDMAFGNETDNAWIIIGFLIAVVWLVQSILPEKKSPVPPAIKDI